MFHSRMKHLVIDYHFIHDLILSLALPVVHVPCGDKLADALTKSLPWPRLLDICNKICVFDYSPWHIRLQI